MGEAAAGLGARHAQGQRRLPAELRPVAARGAGVGRPEVTQRSHDDPPTPGAEMTSESILTWNTELSKYPNMAVNIQWFDKSESVHCDDNETVIFYRKMVIYILWFSSISTIIRRV